MIFKLTIKTEYRKIKMEKNPEFGNKTDFIGPYKI